MDNNKHKLPALKDLHLDPVLAFKNDELKRFLNHPAKSEWLSPGPPGSPAGWKDLPIDKVELLLDIIFQKWKVEVLDIKFIVNSIVTTIRLHYLDPITQEWMFHDGIGAKDIQMDQGSAPNDVSKIKKGGVMMAAPASKTYAIKDAADHLGELFGRSLNRKNVAQFSSMYGMAPQESTPQSSSPGTGGPQNNYEDLPL